MPPMLATDPFDPVRPFREVASPRRLDPVPITAKIPSSAPAPYLTRMAVRFREKIVLISVHDLLWIQSHGNLLRLHLLAATYAHRMTLQDLSRQLDPRRFLRIHRGAIVNLDHVVEFDLPHNRNALVLLRNGIALPISGPRRMDLKRALSLHAYAAPSPDEIASAT